jgi:trk system potassium uptake protein TrkA
VGSQLARQLEANGKVKIKLIDRNPDRCKALGQTLDKTVVLKGDGTDQTLLEEEKCGGRRLLYRSDQ